jgi:hypothetical protein
MPLAILLVGTAILIGSFYVIGTKLDRSILWKHLTWVSLGVVLVTLLIDLVLQLQITGLTIVLALLQTFLAMWIGGALAARKKLIQ